MIYPFENISEEQGSNGFKRGVNWLSENLSRNKLLRNSLIRKYSYLMSKY